MSSRDLIDRIVCECYGSSESPLTDVQYRYIRSGIKEKDILTRYQLSKLETKCAEEQIEILFFDYAPKLGMDGFKKLVNVIREAYPHVAKTLIDELNSADTSQSESTSSMPGVHGAVSPASRGAGNFPATGAESVAVGASAMDLSRVGDGSNNNSRMGLPDLLGHQRDTDEMSVKLKRVSGFETDGKPNAQNQRKKSCYTMDSYPKGIALIISNQKFDNFKEREGTEVDRKNLVQMFHSLGWEVTTERDQSAREMIDSLQLLASYKPLKTTSALAVAILTHGHDSDVLFGRDGKLRDGKPVPGTFINRFQLMQQFTRTCCTGMVNKPKWFILQACRGTEEDCAPDRRGNASQPSKVKSDSPTEPDPPSSPTAPETVRQSSMNPEMAHMCCLFSSSPGYKAYRIRKTGSPFIVALKKCVEEMAYHEEINIIFREVRVKMSEKELPHNIKTLAEASSTLLKDWYLDPPQWVDAELPQSY